MGLRFNGSSQYISAIGAAISAPPFSVTCWIRPDTTSAAMTIFSIGDNSTSNNWWRLSTNVLNRIRWSARDASGEAFATLTTADLVLNRWHFVAGVEIASNLRRVYNGGFNTSNPNSRSPNTPNIMRMGLEVGTGTLSEYYQGGISDLIIWNVALSTAEVRALALGVDPLRIRGGRANIALWLNPVESLRDYRQRYLFVPTASPSLTADPAVPYRRSTEIGYLYGQAATGGDASPTATDSATASDSGQVAASVPAADSASLSESVASAADVPATDTAALSESTAAAATIPTTDSATLSESALVEPGEFPAANDGATLTETAVVMVSVSGSDVALLAESAVSVAALVGSDTAALADVATLDTGEMVYVLSPAVIVPTATAVGVNAPTATSEAVEVPASS